MLTSRQNSRVIEWSRLAGQPTADCALAEGWHLVEEIFRDCPERILTVLVSEKFARTANGKNFSARIPQNNAGKSPELVLLADAVYQKISNLQNPEGVAVVFAPRQVAVEQIFQFDKILIAAGIQDPGNAGALVRIAEAAGMNAAVFTDGVNPVTGKFLRAAMGSGFRLPCVKVDRAVFIELAKKNNFPLFAAAAMTANNALDYREVSFPARFGLLIGGEGAGVAPDFLAAAKAIIHIPLAGKVESLNAAVAAGIILFSPAVRKIPAS